MKRILSLLLIAAMLLTGALSMTACTTFRWITQMLDEKDNDVFDYFCENGEAFVTGLSEAGRSAEPSELVIPAEHDGMPVVGILSSAFSDYREATRVVIPSSVREIGDWAFRGCAGIREITLSEGLETIGSEAFRNCQDLESVTLPSTLTSLGAGAFEKCIALRTAVFLGAIGSLPYGVFRDCVSLTTVILPDGLEIIESQAFGGCKALSAIDLPDSVCEIAAYTFEGCSFLQVAVLPEELSYIPEGLFKGCIFLTRVVLPSAPTSIGDFAFSGCTSLPELHIPESVEHIGREAFAGCSALTTVVLPPMLEWIGEAVFSGCGTLTRIFFTAGSAPDGFNADTSCDNVVDLEFDHTAHVYSEREAFPSTCTVRGTRSFTCDVCGYSRVERLALADHVYDGGFCAECGIPKAGNAGNADKPESPTDTVENDALTEPDAETTDKGVTVETVKPSGGSGIPSVTTKPAQTTTRPIEPVPTDPVVTNPVTEPETTVREPETTLPEPETTTEPVTTTLEDLYGEAPAGYEWYVFNDIAILYPSGWRMSSITGGKQFKNSDVFTMAVVREPASYFDYYTMSDTDYEAMLEYSFTVQGIVGTADVTSFTHTVRNGYKVTRAEIVVAMNGVTAYEIQYMIEIGDYNYSLIFGNVASPDELAVTVFEHLVIIK